jgi:hypothetical protein
LSLYMFPDQSLSVVSNGAFPPYLFTHSIICVPSSPGTVPASLSACESQETEIPYCTVFQFTATNCSEQTVALYFGLTV